MLTDMNDEMVKDLFTSSECGFKAKFMKRFEKWKNDITNPQNVPSIEQVLTIPISSSPNSSLILNESDTIDSVVENDNNLMNLNNLNIISYIRMLF